MFQVRKMSAEDLAFAVRITNEANWGLSEDDFMFAIELEPDGCFTLFDDSERIGVATNISFGEIGWFGNLIVNKECRGRGAGSLLVRHSVRYLTDRKVKAVGLYAYIDKIPFYKQLGFECESEFAVLKGKGLPSTTKSHLKKAEMQDLPKVIDFDRVCFGASREKLLEPILRYPSNICYVSVEDELVNGYSVAKVYDRKAELGPVVCHEGRTDVAVALLSATLDQLQGLEVRTCVPKKENAILRMLKENGFSESFKVARMFLGVPRIENCIYVAESLERG